MLGFKGSTSQQKTKRRIIIIYTGVDGIFYPPLPLKSLKKLDIEDKVLFTGKVSNPLDYMSKSSAFVLSSGIEGMPNTLLEAMKCGLPSIATDTAAAEIIDPDNYEGKSYQGMECCKYGIVVKSKDTASMAMAMKRMYEDKVLRDSYIDAQKGYMKEFTMDKVISGWMDVICKS